MSPIMQQSMEEGEEAIVSKAERQDLRIVSVEEKYAKSGRPMLMVMLTVDGVSPEGKEYSPIFHNMLFATDEELAATFTEGADPDQDKLYKNRKRWALDNRRFCEAFNIPYNAEGFDTDDFPGSQANLMLKVEIYDETGQESNRIVLPRLT